MNYKKLKEICESKSTCEGCECDKECKVFYDVFGVAPVDFADCAEKCIDFLIPKAHWIESNDYWFYCSECEETYPKQNDYSAYCPNCGARMDEVSL